MESIFYSINEATAKAANDVNSMRSYRAGSATESYQDQVRNVYEVVKEIEKRSLNFMRGHREWQQDIVGSWQSIITATIEMKQVVRL